MSTSDIFYQVLEEVIDNIDSGFRLNLESSNPTCDVYQWEHTTGITVLSIDYSEESITIDHDNHKGYRHICVTFKQPMIEHAEEIYKCINML